MHDNLIRRNEKLAKSLIAALGSRNMTGYYAATKEEALQIALSLIPTKSTVTNGGSLSIKEIGLVDAVRAGDYEYCDKYTAEDPRRAELTAYDSDVYMGSVNAITSDGILVNIDGNANRVSAYAYGPRKLVLIVGMNKVAPDVDSALKRARNEAATVCAQSFCNNSPCISTGRCMDCKVIDTVCCQFLITRFSRHTGRIHVILVNERLGI